jgi:hypothetical protein
MRKQFQKNLVIVLKHQKILGKFQTFQENSQRHLGTSNPNKILGAQEKDFRAF